jgi:hypothetical protein
MYVAVSVMNDVQSYVLVSVFAFLFTLSEGVGMSSSESNSVIELIIKALQFYRNLLSNKTNVDP